MAGAAGGLVDSSRRGPEQEQHDRQDARRSAPGSPPGDHPDTRHPDTWHPGSRPLGSRQPGAPAPDAGRDDTGGRRDQGSRVSRRADRLTMVALGALAVGVQAVLWQRFQRPLWYDELWRPHFTAEPAQTFWTELASANTPLAAGYLLLTRAAGELLGWHAWALRLPSGLALVALTVGTFALARRFTGPVAAAGAALAAGLGGTVVDLGTQLKPYTLEAACTIAVVMLWLGPRDRPARRPVARRTAAGVLALFSLPAVFLLVPLAAADLVTARGRRLRAAAGALPALVLAGAHLLLFVLHQSSQRASTFWDDHFLAGRGPLDGAWFVVRQLAATAAGAPPGVDRYDPNLVHPLTDSADWAVALLAAAVAAAVVAGVVALRRRPGGPVLLAALGGAELVMLAASADRYWPFGAVRTNLFVVPMVAVVVAAGAAALGRLARERLRHRWFVHRLPVHGRPAGARLPRLRAWLTAGAAAAAAVVVALTAAVPAAAASALHPLWRERGETRPIELMVDATIAARRLYQPGDLVVVGGRLARAGWLYGMEVSEDGPFRSRPSARPVGPRVPREATVFLPAIGQSGVRRALEARGEPPEDGKILLFVLAYDRRRIPKELADARDAGWCATREQYFELTGTLYTLTRCTP